MVSSVHQKSTACAAVYDPTSVSWAKPACSSGQLNTISPMLIANSAIDSPMNPREKKKPRRGSQRSNAALGSPSDQRMRSSSPLNSRGLARRCRSARSRSSWRVLRSLTERSRRPIRPSFWAKPSTAASETPIPASWRAAAASPQVRVPSSERMTVISTARNRKYLWLSRSFTT